MRALFYWQNKTPFLMERGLNLNYYNSLFSSVSVNEDFTDVFKLAMGNAKAF